MSTGWYWSLSYKNVAKIRGGLVDGVSQKMLRLSQQHGTESKVLTVMINDVYRITSTLAFSHELWVAPIETAIGTWLLCRQVGPPGLVVLGIIGGKLCPLLLFMGSPPLSLPHYLSLHLPKWN